MIFFFRLDEIKQKDAIEIINKMDYNKDGKIEWNEFLQVMYDWLKSLGILNDIGNSSDSSVRKNTNYRHGL